MKKIKKTDDMGLPTYPPQNQPVKTLPVQTLAPKPPTVKPEPPRPQPANLPAKIEPFRPEPAKTQAAPPAPAGASAPKTGVVSLELVQPGAKQVCVAGSFNDWKPERTPLRSLGNGHWVGNLAVRPGRHEYLFVVDGQWLPDPNAKESVQNPFGGKNSVVTVSG